MPELLQFVSRLLLCEENPYKAYSENKPDNRRAYHYCNVVETVTREGSIRILRTRGKFIEEFAKHVSGICDVYNTYADNNNQPSEERTFDTSHI